MNKILKPVAGAMLLGCIALSSCSDWTEPESLKVEYPTIETQNPEQYARYLENLRRYKQSEHKLVYAWFDNSVKEASSRAHHLTDIPDSIDVVGLMYPEGLTQDEVSEIARIRNEKGMKVIYDVDFDQIKAVYNEHLLNLPEGEPEAVPFRTFLTDSLAHALSLSSNFDGLCIKYSGKSSLHMEEDELDDYTQNENCFIGIVSDWLSRHEGKLLVFQGKPQNLLDQSVLEKCSVVFINGMDAGAVGDLSQLVTLGYVESCQGRYGVVIDRKGSISTNDFASWALTPQTGGYLYAAGLYDISGDYYASERIYDQTRKMIAILNPSVN